MIELNGETYLDGNEACSLLGIKAATLYSYASRGVLRSYRQGIKRRRLYKRSELEALLQLRPSADVQQHRHRDDDLPPAEDWVPNV
ncbi:MAG: helix-turn-helix domain-containing protein [Ktedonobacteraceae bacterium]